MSHTVSHPGQSKEEPKPRHHRNPLSQHPNHSSNSGAHDPVSRILHHHAPRGSTRTRTTTRTIVRPIRQSPIDNNSLRPIHIPHMYQTAILRRHTPIPNQLSQIRAIIIIIASARAVLLTQTCHGECLVLIRGLRGVGRIVETVGVVVVVFVGAVEPEPGEDEETGAEEGEGEDAGGGARAGAVGRAGPAGEVTSTAVGGGDGRRGAVGGQFC